MTYKIDKKKKVAIKATAYLGKSPNGAEPFTLIFFCKYLEEFGYEVNIIGAEILPDELAQFKNYNYINYLYLPRILRMFLHIPISFLNTFFYSLRERPDLLMCVGGVLYNGLGVYFSGKLLGIKCLVRTAEDHYNFYKFCTTLGSKLFHFLLNKQISHFVLKRSDYVLTTGSESRKYFILKGVQKENIYGIPGKIEIEKFYRETSDLKKNLNIQEEKKIILFVGALSGLKGANLIPYLVKKINSRSKDYVFLIVGDENEYGSKIKKSIKSLNEENIIFLDSQPREELRKIYSIGEVLVFLCRVGVGYGQVTIEASACDLPVLSLNPGKDVKWWLTDACCNSLDEMVDRILVGEYSKRIFPLEFDEEKIKKKYKRMFNYILSLQ